MWVCALVSVSACASVRVPVSESLSSCVPLPLSAPLCPFCPYPSPAVTVDPLPGRLGHRTRPPQPLAVPQLCSLKLVRGRPYNKIIQTPGGAWGRATLHTSPTSPSKYRVSSPVFVFGAEGLFEGRDNCVDINPGTPGRDQSKSLVPHYPHFSEAETEDRASSESSEETLLFAPF